MPSCCRRPDCPPNLAQLSPGASRHRVPCSRAQLLCATMWHLPVSFPPLPAHFSQVSLSPALSLGPPLKTWISVPRGLPCAAGTVPTAGHRVILLLRGTLRRPGYFLCWRPPVSDTHLVQGRSGENTAYLSDGMSKKDLVTFSRACVHSSLLLYDLS